MITRALLAKRGHLHRDLQTQKLALSLRVITQEAEAHSLTARSHSHSHLSEVQLHASAVLSTGDRDRTHRLV